MICKKCGCEMDLINDEEKRKLFFCDSCYLFFDADSPETISNALGYEDLITDTDEYYWKKLQEPMAYRVMYWIGNNETCSCHRRQDMFFKDFYSFQEAKEFTVNFLADSEVKDGEILSSKFKDRGIHSIFQVGSEDFYNKEEIIVLTKIEIERRMSDVVNNK